MEERTNCKTAISLCLNLEFSLFGRSHIVVGRWNEYIRTNSLDWCSANVTCAAWVYHCCHMYVRLTPSLILEMVSSPIQIVRSKPVWRVVPPRRTPTTHDRSFWIRTHVNLVPKSNKNVTRETAKFDMIRLNLHAMPCHSLVAVDRTDNDDDDDENKNKGISLTQGSNLWYGWLPLPR